MREAVIAEVSTQLSEVVGVIERHLEPTLLAVHLYGSAVDGGLKPHSDIDLLVTVTVRLDETTRRALINDLLETALLQIVGMPLKDNINNGWFDVEKSWVSILQPHFKNVIDISKFDYFVSFVYRDGNW
ncbi:hypothetical protein B9G35_29960 (plasmid) [Klebsiella pneumoniae]|nr:hypothetical protein B9G35_29960 [Klebsiella pneumoniae]